MRRDGVLAWRSGVLWTSSSGIPEAEVGATNGMSEENMAKNLCSRRLLVALATAIGLTIPAQLPAAATTLTVGKAAPNSDPIIPVNVGDKLGIFKKHGLDLK